MDELDLLKSHWQKDDIKGKQLSSKEIYPLLLKKSSSIVKTLFYISIAELTLWVFINFIFPFLLSDDYSAHLQTVYGNPFIMKAITGISFVVILLFVYLLYKSYKSISVTDNAKKLMESILNTRKVVKYYVLFNLIYAFISMIIGLYYGITRNSEIMTKLDEASSGKVLIIIGVGLLLTFGFVFVIWLIYRLVYGILLKRLNKNYGELKKLEV